MCSSDQNEKNCLHKHGNHSFHRYEIILALRYYIHSVMYIHTCLLYISAHTVSGSTNKHTKLEIDLVEITKCIYLTLTLYFNSHTLLHSSHASIQFSTGHLPDHICFFTMLTLNCSRIHLSHSFFLLPWNISNTQITPHHSYTLLSPHSSFHTNIVYFHSSMATTTTHISHIIYTHALKDFRHFYYYLTRIFSATLTLQHFLQGDEVHSSEYD